MILQQSMIHGKYHGFTSYLLGNIRWNGNHVNDRQTRRTDESQMMMSRRSRTSQSHKRLAQTKSHKNC